MKAPHVPALLALVGAAGLFWWGTQASGGTPPPDQQEPTGSRAADLHALGFAGSQVHLAPAGPGNVLLPHRYPNGIGDNITLMIESGFLPLRIPRGDDWSFFTRPPSEANL